MKRSNQQFTGIKYGPNKILGEKIKNKNKNKNKKNIIIVIWQNDIKFLSVHDYINGKKSELCILWKWFKNLKSEKQ